MQKIQTEPDGFHGPAPSLKLRNPSESCTTEICPVILQTLQHSQKAGTSESIGTLQNENMATHFINMFLVSILTSTARISKNLSHEFISTTRDLDQSTTLPRHKFLEMQNGTHYVAFCGPLSDGWGLLVTEPDVCAASSVAFCSSVVSVDGVASPDVTQFSAGDPEQVPL